MRLRTLISLKKLLSLLLVFVLLISSLSACDLDSILDNLQNNNATQAENNNQNNTPNSNQNNNGNQNPNTGTTAPKNTLNAYTFQGLTFYLSDDYKRHESSTGESDIFVNSDSVTVTVLYRTTLPDFSDSKSFAQYFETTYSNKGYKVTLNTANGVSYSVTDYNDGTIEVRGFYVASNHCWMIFFTIPGTTYSNEIVDFATKCQIDPNLNPEVPDVPSSAPEQKDTVTVHTLVPESWGIPHCWAWKNGGENVFDVWPGASMQLSGAYYCTEITSWADYVIINGNNGSIQTEDIAIEAGRELWILVHKDGSYYSVFYHEPTAEELAQSGY